jgi:hypothetical protein
MGFRILTSSFLLILGLSSTSLASEQEDASSRIYVVLGGGTYLRFTGFGEGFYPAAQAGVGYRWWKLEFEADFLFSTIEWKKGVLGVPEDPRGYRFDPGQLFGLLIAVKAYPYSFESSVYPYAVVGIGGQVVRIDSIYNEDSGTMIGLALRAGVGAEIRIAGYLYFDIEAHYTNTEFFKEINYYSPDNAGGFCFMGAFKLYF